MRSRNLQGNFFLASMPESFQNHFTACYLVGIISVGLCRTENEQVRDVDISTLQPKP